MLSNEQIARRYYDLVNARRFDEAEMLVSTDSVFRYPHSKDNLIGRAGYRELIRLWTLAFPDATATVWRVTDVNDGIVDVEIVGRGTHLGPLSFGGPLSLPATGKLAELLFRDRLTIQDQQITESTFQFDMKEMLRRLIGVAELTSLEMHRASATLKGTANRNSFRSAPSASTACPSWSSPDSAPLRPARLARRVAASQVRRLRQQQERLPEPVACSLHAP